MERWLWPALAALLYVTFVQVPVVELRDALGHRPFLMPNWLIADPARKCR